MMGDYTQLGDHSLFYDPSGRIPILPWRVCDTREGKVIAAFKSKKLAQWVLVMIDHAMFEEVKQEAKRSKVNVLLEEIEQ